MDSFVEPSFSIFAGANNAEPLIVVGSVRLAKLAALVAAVAA
jgi:hypothetical protein